MRRTIIVHNAYALRVTRFALARLQTVDTHVLTIEGLAAKLAGGFIQPLSSAALVMALETLSYDRLGELDRVAALPGFRRAAAATLQKAFTAGIDISRECLNGEYLPRKLRLSALAIIEERVLAQLPQSMRKPLDLVHAAIARATHAARLFGEIEVRGHTELAPVWRSLLAAVAQHTNVRWIAGPAHVPAWLGSLPIETVRSAASSPVVTAQSCANPRHEVLEAFRWARSLIIDHGVRPADIAIAAATCDTWDDHVAALSATSDLPMYSAHGERALRTPDGQTAAALAELLLFGSSASRCRRFISLPRYGPDEKAERMQLLDALLALGIDSAAEIGERLLTRGALALWNQALLEGPPQALDTTLASLRIQPNAEDDASPEFAVVWCSAAALASAPRAYVRLLGLTSRAWPRAAGEDPLLPAHIILPEFLDPLPVHLADRRDFATILATTTHEVACSRARRDADGRINGISPLWPTHVPQIHRGAHRIPQHAASAADRLAARGAEFAATITGRHATAAWQDWQSDELTAHDGMLPAHHPVLDFALDRIQSATSLSMLLRDPLAYLWTYGFGWKCDDEAEEPLRLDARMFGELLHGVIDRALKLRGAASIDAAVAEVAIAWAHEHPLPPALIWKVTLDRAANLAYAALTFDQPAPAGSCFSEVAFGESVPPEIREDASLWDMTAPVYIRDSEVRIRGRIDRLDIAEDGTWARVTDYKSGRTFPHETSRLIGGTELQRVLYASAVRSLLPQVQVVESRLLYPRAAEIDKPMSYVLDDGDAVLAELSEYIAVAQGLMRRGVTLPHCGSGGDVELDPELKFALPARAEDWYFERKHEVFFEQLLPLTKLWNAP